MFMWHLKSCVLSRPSVGLCTSGQCLQRPEREIAALELEFEAVVRLTPGFWEWNSGHLKPHPCHFASPLTDVAIHIITLWEFCSEGRWQGKSYSARVNLWKDLTAIVLTPSLSWSRVISEEFCLEWGKVYYLAIGETCLQCEFTHF